TPAGLGQDVNRVDGRIAGADHAGGAISLDPLVVAVAAAPGVGDHAQAPGGGLKHGAGGVDVAETGDLWIDQTAGGGEHLDDRLVQQPAGEVQVVDGEVLEQAAAGRDKPSRRGGRVVIDDVQALERADRAGV